MEHTDKSTYGSTADEWQYTRRDYNPSEGKRDQWHAPGIATVDVTDDGTFAIWARDEPGGELVLVQIPAAVARAMAERRLELDLETINNQRGGYALGEIEEDVSPNANNHPIVQRLIRYCDPGKAG